MYELVQLNESCYYIQSPAKIGLIKIGENEVCLIDSGNDKDAGRRIRQILDVNGWSLNSIFITHSNADHIGGNKYLQAQTGCRIYAPGIECDFSNHTILEPAFLYGGYPPKDICHKFLRAQESDVLPLEKAVLPEGLEAVELPGHFFDMVGYRYNGVLYLADCLSSKVTLDKYGVGFIYDVGAYLDTLEKVKEMKADVFVPSHADASKDIRELVQYNIDKVNEIAEKILGLCCGPITFESLLSKLFFEYGLKMSFEQYCLVGSTLRSYLAWLKNSDKLDSFFENNLLYWKKNDIQLD